MNTYEKCCSIRHMILTRAAEVINYDWDAEFSKKNVKEFPYDLKNKINTDDEDFFNIQPAELTKEEMDQLNFGRWSEGDPMRLIPLWLFPFLAEKIKTRCIDDKEYIKKSEMDNDHRFGYMAYGVIPKEKNKCYQK
jgi:hypothetical protein